MCVCMCVRMCVCVCVHLNTWIWYRETKKQNGIVEWEVEREEHLLEQMEFGVIIKNRES